MCRKGSFHSRPDPAYALQSQIRVWATPALSLSIDRPPHSLQSRRNVQKLLASHPAGLWQQSLFAQPANLEDESVQKSLSDQDMHIFCCGSTPINTNALESMSAQEIRHATADYSTSPATSKEAPRALVWRNVWPKSLPSLQHQRLPG
eukprot:3971802-Amphidinium_carterae.1